jgi:4-amino-4-deoxy-L-arabinose transferase-like glycosyltransferase
LQYAPHPWSQATALSHSAWGALFALVLGSSFTVMSIAGLTASALCLLVFYRLMRVLDVTPPLALVGSALLLAQPVFFHLSTTFMTDITFLLAVLVACLLFVRWAQTERNAYLWAASGAVALAFLNRQLGAVLVFVPLAYLWATRRLTWRSALAAALLPSVALVAYFAWERGQPHILVSMLLEKPARERLQEPVLWLARRAVIAGQAWVFAALFLVPLFRPTRRLLAAGVALAVLGLMLWATYVSTGTVAPFTGNVVDHRGFLDCCIEQSAAVWNEGVWVALAVVGAASAAFLMARTSNRLDMHWVGHGRPLPDNAAALVYGSAAVLTAAALLLPLTFFDRYYLPLMPALILFACREASRQGMARGELALRWTLVAPVLLFSVAAQHDNVQSKEIRWEESERLVSQGVGRDRIGMSFEWGGEYLFDAEADRIKQSGDFASMKYIPYYVIDPEYYVSEKAIEGYDVVRTEHYTSWLEFGQTHTILVQKRR